MTAPTVACLLPARNAVDHLPGWFASVERFADLVVALDDGSTDDTGAMLRSHPLVSTVIANPVRPTYAGWDDAANRQRLVDALHPLRADWVIQLDADERIDADDALALRTWIDDGGPDRTCAYLFQMHRMVDDVATFDRTEYWAGRMFAYRSGLTLPTETLHFVPLPDDIAPARWLKTTVRIQHLANITEEHRAERYRKYQEVDPNLEFQASYEHLLDAPTAARPWRSRPPELPMLLHGTGGAPGAVLDGGDPAVMVRGPLEMGRPDLVHAWVAAQVTDHVCLVEVPFDLQRDGSGLTTTTAGAAMSTVRAATRSRVEVLLDSLAAPGECPARCRVFRRDVLLHLLAEQPLLSDPGDITDVLWELGYGVGDLVGASIVAGSWRSSRRPRRGHLLRSWERGVQFARRVVSHREHAAASGPSPSTFGPRPALRRFRAAVVVVRRDEPMHRWTWMVPLAGLHVVVEQIAGRRTLSRGAA